MRLFDFDENLKKQIKPALIIISFAICLFFVLFNLSTIVTFIKRLIGLFDYLIYGAIIAYVLNQPMKLIEKLIEKKYSPDSFIYRKRRAFSLITTLILVLILLVLIISILVPSLIDSLISIIGNITNLLTQVVNNIDQIFIHLNSEFRVGEVSSVQEFINMPWQNMLRGILDFLSKNADGIMNNATNFLGQVGFAFTSFIFSLYLLINKEKFILQLRQVIGAICGYRCSVFIFNYASRINSIFANFITGQLTEACILWGLYFSSMHLFNFPYPELIATIIALFSFVPFFGPLTAMAVGAILILSQDALMAIIFMIYFQLLSQIEDNLIYPRVVGNSVGLPGIWVLLSIFVFSRLFGIPGTMIAVPSAACLYSLIKDGILYLLQRRHLKITVATIEKE